MPHEVDLWVVIRKKKGNCSLGILLGIGPSVFVGASPSVVLGMVQELVWVDLYAYSIVV